MPGPFREGPLTRQQADHLNRVWAVAEKVRRLTAKPPLTFDLTAANPVVRLAPQDRPLLATVTAAAHPRYTVKRQTRTTADGIEDFAPLESIETVVSPFEMEAGDVCQVYPIVDWPGWWWAQPAGGGGDSADGEGCCGADCAWLAGLTDADCLTATVRPNPTGLCSEIDDTQSLPLESADGVTWVSADDFATDNYVGPLTFTAGTGNENPSLSITDGGTYEFRHLGCQGGKLAFAGGGPLVCTDGTPVDCGNAFVVLIGCGCPPPAAVQTACADHEIPSTLYAHLVLTATGCGFDTNVELVYGGVSEAPTGWGAEFAAGGCTWRFYLNHGSAGGDCWQWNLKNMETDTADGGPTTSYTADPSLIIAESQGASVLGVGETCCTYGGGGVTIAYTVTE